MSNLRNRLMCLGKRVCTPRNCPGKKQACIGGRAPCDGSSFEQVGNICHTQSDSFACQRRCRAWKKVKS